MTFLLILLLFALGLGLVMTLFVLSLTRIQSQTARQFEERVQDANQIMQSERAPTSWVTRERRQIERLRRAGKDDQAIARVGRRAQQRCRRQLASLINFLENGQFYDTLETRAMMIDALSNVAEKWATASWEAVVDGSAPEREA